jgi:hypothetical protein
MSVGKTLHLTLEATRPIGKAETIEQVLQALNMVWTESNLAPFQTVQISAVQTGLTGVVWDAELALTAIAPSVNSASTQATPQGSAETCLVCGKYTLRFTDQGCRIDMAPSLPLAWTPRALPRISAPTDPVGLELALEQVITAMQQHRFIVLTGERGTGKTTLLRSLSHYSVLRQWFPDGVVYLRVGWRSRSDLLQDLFHQFYATDALRPTDTEMFQAFQGKQALILLDQAAWQLQEFEALSRSLPSFTFVAATYHSLPGDYSGAAISLSGLTLADSLILLARELDRTIAPDQRHTAEALCHLLQGHPLRLLQAVDLINQGHFSLVTLVEQLQGTSLELLLLRFAGCQGRQRNSTRSQQERQSLAVLAVLAGLGEESVTVPQLAALVGIEDISPALAPLVKGHLVLVTGQRVQLAPNLLLPLQTTWNLNQWSDRTFNCFAAWADQARPDPTLLADEVDVLWHLTGQAIATSRWATALSLSRLLDYLLWARGNWMAWEQVLHWQIQAGESSSNLVAVAQAEHQLGTLALCRDETALARDYLTRALATRRDLDPAAVALTRWNLERLQSQGMPPDGNQPLAASVPPQPSPRIPRRFDSLPLVLLAALIGGGGLLALLLWLFPAEGGRVSTSRDRLDFAPQTLHTSSDPQPVTLRNDNSTPLTITSLELQGAQATDFQITEDCTDAPLAQGEDCTVAVSFTPQSTGDRQSTLWFTEQQGSRQSLLVLAGQGIEQPAEQTLRITPGNIYFGPQGLSRPSEFQVVTLHNDGTEVIALQAISPLGEHRDDFWSRHSCTDAPLAPGDRCTVEVVFEPTEPGPRQARLAIASEIHPTTGTRQFWTIPLRGEGETVEETRFDRDAIPVSPSSPSSPPPPSAEPVSAASDSPQIREFAATHSTLEVGQSTDLCYAITDAVEVTLDGETVNSEAGCLTISPQASRAYTLVAIGVEGQQVEETVEITVNQPVLTVPTSLTPGSTDAMQIPDLSPCEELLLQWTIPQQPAQAVSLVTIQEQEFPYTGDVSAVAQSSPTIPWITVFEEPVPGTSLDISQQVGSQLYRWAVRSQDAAGNTSDPASWSYFICSP